MNLKFMKYNGREDLRFLRVDTVTLLAGFL